MLSRALLGLLLIAAVGYVLDWAVWRARVAAGGGMGEVQVDLYTVAELKGGKEDLLSAGDGCGSVQPDRLSAGRQQSLLVADAPQGEDQSLLAPLE